jgi:hypothetical protein
MQQILFFILIFNLVILDKKGQEQKTGGFFQNPNLGGLGKQGSMPIFLR